MRFEAGQHVHAPQLDPWRLHGDLLVVDLGDESFRLKKSFEAADKMGARYLLIVGENEVAANAFALKHLASGEQVTVPRAELAQRILQKK